MDVQQVKLNMVQGVFHAYKTFLEAIKPFSGAKAEQVQALVNFKQGYLWLVDSIMAANIKIGDDIPKPQVNDDSETPQVSD